MNKDIRDGNRSQFETGDYFHNEKIDYIFNVARNKAWASIMRDPKINDLVIKQRKKKISRNKKSIQSRGELTPILRIYK